MSQRVCYGMSRGQGRCNLGGAICHDDWGQLTMGSHSSTFHPTVPGHPFLLSQGDNGMTGPGCWVWWRWSDMSSIGMMMMMMYYWYYVLFIIEVTMINKWHPDTKQWSQIDHGNYDNHPHEDFNPWLLSGKLTPLWKITIVHWQI